MRILYVSTLSNTMNAFMLPHIEYLHKQGHKIDIACNVRREIDPSFLEMNCNVFQVDFARSPFSKENIKAYRQVKAILRKSYYDLVHVHTPVASTITRIACKNSTTGKIVYTAHGFHFFEGAPKLNWVIYYPIERLLSSFTDCIITINNEDKRRAEQSLNAKKIDYMPGVGLDISKITSGNIDRKEKREQLKISQNSFVILSVGELNENKNHEIIIQALAEIKTLNICYLICGAGPLESYLIKLAKDLKIEEQVKILGFRNDIYEICKVADVFAFPSKREGLGMAALEAMAVGLPLLTSNVHGINDYSKDGVTGYTYDHGDYIGFSEGIKDLYYNPKKAKLFGENNKKNVYRYDIDNSLKELNRIYESILK